MGIGFFWRKSTLPPLVDFAVGLAKNQSSRRFGHDVSGSQNGS